MTIFSEEEYSNNFRGASKEIIEALVSNETSQKIKIILTRHGVLDKGFDISASIGYMLVGLIPVKRFIQSLQEDAELNEKIARNVAHDVRAEIFAPIVKELAQIQEQAENNWQKAQENIEDRIKIPQKEIPKKDFKNENALPREEKEPEQLKVKLRPPNPKYDKYSLGELKDESVVREIFPEPEVNDEKFSNEVEKKPNMGEDKRF